MVINVFKHMNVSQEVVIPMITQISSYVNLNYILDKETIRNRNVNMVINVILKYV